MSQDRAYLRTTFDKEALLYDKARPGYPEAMFDDIVAFSGIATSGHILEIGSGTGQATLPLARRGYHILCVDPGSHLVAVAHKNLSSYPQVQWYVSDFEQWPVEPEIFDIVLCATAFHWLDPKVAYSKIVQTLKPRGTLALCWNIHVQCKDSAGFFEVVQKVYQREVPQWNIPSRRLRLPWPHEVAETRKDEIVQTGLFESITIRNHVWQESYTSKSYTHLINTYSDHIALDSTTREHLARGIAATIDNKFGGCITKGYLSRLYLARKK